jgi:sodium/bile acid cotransporter 7
MRTYLLPVGLVAAICLALLFPEPGRNLELVRLGPVAPLHLLIFAIFLVSGLSLQSLGPLSWKRVSGAVTVALVLHFAFWPLLAWGFLSLFPVPWSFGIMVTAVVPTTLSSAIIITRQAGGTEWLAILLTVSLSFVGVFASPFLLSLFMNEAHGSFPVGPLVTTLVLTVAVPLALGWSLRQLHPPRWVDLIPTLCIIAAVWLSSSRHQQDLVSLKGAVILGMAVSAIALHLIMTICGWASAKGIRLDRGERIALAVVTGQKTLPFSLALLAGLPAGKDAETLLSLAVAFCVIFHFIQIIIDSIWAGTLRNHHATSGHF